MTIYSVSSIVGEMNNYEAMAGKKLRSRSVSSGRNIDKVGSESSRPETESLNPGSETQLDGDSVEIDGVNDRPVSGHCGSGNNGGVSASQLQEFMNTVMKGFSDLKDSMKSENAKLTDSIKTLSEEMTIKIEVANNNLSDRLTKQFREETASLKKEISDELRSEVLNLREAINQLRKDTDIEVISMSHNVDTVREQLSDSMDKQMGVAQKQMERVSQEMKKRTRDLETDLVESRREINKEVVSIRQEMVELGVRISNEVTEGAKTVLDNVTECKDQILAEKESNAIKFQNLNQEVEGLKARLAIKQFSENVSVTKRNNQQNSATDVDCVSHDTTTPSGSVCEVHVNQNLPTCTDVVNNEMSHTDTTNTRNAISEMPLSRDWLNEISLPIFLDCSKQSVVTFLRDLDMFFELKKVPESLKLPFVLRAIKDPFAQNWVSSAYQKIDSYQSFKSQFSKLFWNELEQSRVRCDIYQGKYNRNGRESMTEHYVRYASLGANLQPPLTEYDVVTALTSHFPMEIQRAMLAANLRTSQEALAFLGRMQSLEISIRSN